MALFRSTRVLLVVLLPFIRCDIRGGKYEYGYHPEYTFARCDFGVFDGGKLANLTGPSNSLEVPPFASLLPASIAGIMTEADGGYGGIEIPPERYISVRLRQRVARKYGRSFPLEIAVHAYLREPKYGHVNLMMSEPMDEPARSIGLHVREYGVDSHSEGCKAAGEDYNPLHTSHGNIWDNPHKRHVGDWGNVRLTSGSYVDARFNDYLASIDPSYAGELSILGKSIVLFTREDDLGKKKNDQSTTDGSVGSPALCCAVKMSDGSDFPHDGPTVPTPTVSTPSTLPTIPTVSPTLPT